MLFSNNKFKFKEIIILVFAIMGFLFLSGCGGNYESLEERIRHDYSENQRMDKFFGLSEKYDGNKIILWMNSDEDSWWITNFSIWVVSLLLPDLPEILACGGLLGIIYFVAWWISVTLCGGGILAVLAYISGKMGGIPGIPPAIAGILYLGIMFVMLINLFGVIF